MFYDSWDYVLSSCCSSISASSDDDRHQRFALPAALARSCAAPPWVACARSPPYSHHRLPPPAMR
jgi:hypothetical protein